MMHIEALSQIVRDTLRSSKDRDQTEEVIQELTVKELAGDLDVNDLTSEGLPRRIRRMARSFRVKSPSLTRKAEDKKALSVCNELDSNLPQDWERLLIGFSKAERERMLEPARRGETDQRNLAKAIGLNPRAFRYRIQAIGRNATK